MAHPLLNHGLHDEGTTFEDVFGGWVLGNDAMVFPLATVAIGSATFMVIMWFFSACGADVRQAERRSLAEAFAGHWAKGLRQMFGLP